MVGHDEQITFRPQLIWLLFFSLVSAIEVLLERRDCKVSSNDS
jgi:hypothetical protein